MAEAGFFPPIWFELTTLALPILRSPSALRLSVRWGDRELRRRLIWRRGCFHCRRRRGRVFHFDAMNEFSDFQSFPILVIRLKSRQVKSDLMRTSPAAPSEIFYCHRYAWASPDEPATALSRLVPFWKAQAAETTQKWPRCRAAPQARTASVDGGAPDEPRHQGGPSCESRPGMQMRRGCARQSGPRRRDTILRWPQRGPRTARAARPMWGEGAVVSDCMQRAA